MARCQTRRVPSQETERACGQATSTPVTFMKWPCRVARGATSPSTPHTLRVLSAEPETRTLGGEEAGAPRVHCQAQHCPGVAPQPDQENLVLCYKKGKAR